MWILIERIKTYTADKNDFLFFYLNSFGMKFSLSISPYSFFLVAPSPITTPLTTTPSNCIPTRSNTSRYEQANTNKKKTPWHSMRLLFSDSPDHPTPEVTLHKTCNLCPVGSTTADRRPTCYRPWSLADGTSYLNHHHHHTSNEQHNRHAAVARLRVSLTHAMAEHMADLAFAANSAPKTLNAANPSIGVVPPKVMPVQYHCSYCRFACSWKYDLELHLKQKHGVHKKLWIS